LNVRIQLFKMADFEAMRALFASYFQPDDKLLSPNYTSWLYVDNPFGAAQVAIVEDEGRWVGFMALVPVELARAGGKRLLAYYVVNVLVHPAHHGKNLFGRMIETAKFFVAERGAALMGHPNDMAIKSWVRNDMQFRQPLLPRLVRPRWWAAGAKAQALSQATSLQGIDGWLKGLPEQSSGWRVAASAAYLQWRFLQHPTNRYRVQLVARRGDPIAVLATRQIRPGAHLLIDTFAAETDFDAACVGLPWLTVAFRPEAHAKVHPKSWWRLPIKKQMPMFATLAGAASPDANWAALGLSTSDF
jgi:GNAT superfamily N-acetyltransferase